jgi:predicted nucleic acid-binding protein
VKRRTRHRKHLVARDDESSTRTVPRASSDRAHPESLSERIRSTDEAEAMDNFYKLHLCEAPIDAHLLSRSSEIAFRGNVTVYDAIPVALAILKKTKCITADQETQYTKLKLKGYPIELL